MTGVTGQHSASRIWTIALTTTLVLSLVSAQVALAYPPIHPYGYDNSEFETDAWFDSGDRNYKAFGYSFDNYGEDRVDTEVRGFNNGVVGWHRVDRAYCAVYAYAPAGQRSCTTRDIYYDQAPGGGSPGSGSTGRYATTQHYVTWSGGNDIFYTSGDNNARAYHSSFR